MNTLNLCIIAPEFLPIWGGTGSYVVELVKNLPKDVKVHVMTLKRKTPQMTHKDSRRADPKDVFDREMNIHYISSAEETFFYNLGFQAACFAVFPQLHKENSFDILHSQFGHMSDLLLQLLKKVHIPTVTTVHGTIALLKETSYQCNTRFSDLEWSEKQLRTFYPILRTLELFYARHISRFIAVSKTTRDRIMKDLRVKREKISTVYNGVDVELFQPPKSTEENRKYSEPTVVYVGRMLAKKGIHILIKAMPEVLQEFPDARFLFVGGGNIHLYRETIRRIGIPKKNFSFLGHIGYFERPKILRSATVFVNPSIFENCSLSILEAMSCGGAVVASEVGGNLEIIHQGRNGQLIPVFDEKKLAKSIISLLEDENLNREIGKEARKTVERSFSSEKCAEETYKVYKQMLDAK
jgi:glycosyltransferase involved in cell wall biosynthesis